MRRALISRTPFVYQPRHSFLDLKEIKKKVQHTKMPTRQEMIDQAKDNFNRFKQLLKDF